MSKIIHGDCRSKLWKLKDVDMIFTDPPFAISNSRNSSGASKKFSGYSSNKGEWDEYVPAEDWVPQACNALRKGGIFACFGTFGSLVPIFKILEGYGPYMHVLHINMMFQSHIIWHKTNPAPSIHRRMLTHANEIILVYSKGPKWYFNYEFSKTLNDGKQCHNVFNYPAVKKVLGVTAKPVGLCEQIIQLFCPVDGIVVDPFAGSGAIPEAANNTLRDYIAIEKRKDLVEYMRKKL